MTEAQCRAALSRMKTIASDVRRLSAELADIARILAPSNRSAARRSIVPAPSYYHSVPDAVVKRLRDALGGVRGKLYVADAMRLAGFPQESHYGTTVVGQTMNRLGWMRRRCRLDGELKYAYVKGTPLQQEIRLEIRRGKRRLIVKAQSRNRSDGLARAKRKKVS